MKIPDKPPTSSWILYSNKGVKVSNGQLELTINDEKYSGGRYIIDVTMKNVGNSPVGYSSSDFKVKGADGMPYSHVFFYGAAGALLSGDLPPGEMVRGDVTFDTNNTSGNTMIIYAESFGGPFLNTGSLPKIQ